MDNFFKSGVTIPQTCNDCLGTFLQSVSNQFEGFAQHFEDNLYFINDVDLELQTFIDSFDCEEAMIEIKTSSEVEPIIVLRLDDPTIDVNPEDTGTVWINEKTGDSFVCTNATMDANVWIGMKTGKLIRPVPSADKFDFFGDSSTILFSLLDGNSDDVGGLYPGKETKMTWEPVFDHLMASSDKNGTIKFKKLPIDEDTDVVTVASWIYWNGNNSVMPYGWDSYNIWCEAGKLGFNTKNGDMFGLDFKDYKKKFAYMVTVFKKGEPGKIFINGYEQTLEQSRGNFNIDDAEMADQFSIFGSNSGSGYRKFGWVGRLRIFNRELEPYEVGMLTQAEVDMITYVGGAI